uniref:Ovule protein n=1 Tax=Rhabditophanes sp. KR3021 TaxID=114890 RepID=A0AC35U916_9BILA
MTKVSIFAKRTRLRTYSSKAVYRFCVQVAKCPDDPDILITLLPGHFLYQLEDQQNIRMLRFPKQQLDLESTTKPIHRMTYHLNPIYTAQQLHIKNIKSKDKINLFHLQQNKPWLH